MSENVAESIWEPYPPACQPRVVLIRRHKVNTTSDGRDQHIPTNYLRANQSHFPRYLMFLAWI
jgi:hypothetical protein